MPSSPLGFAVQARAEEELIAGSGETQPGSQTLYLEGNEVRPNSSIRLSSILSSSLPNTVGPVNVTPHRLFLKPHWAVPGLCCGLSTAHPLPDIGELTLGFVFLVMWDVPGCLSSITLLMELGRCFRPLKWLCLCTCSVVLGGCIEFYLLTWKTPIQCFASSS